MNYVSLIDQICEWIRGKVEESSSRGVVLGLSGGLDSSVVLGLAARAMGEGAAGIIMPCHSNPEDEEHARRAADNFGVEIIRLPLEKPFDSLLDIMPPVDDVLTHANVKARLRMTALYYVANCRSYLVAGTGNRSELTVGYFTKYGDGGADILPLGGLLKTQVRELAATLGVPREIIDKPPSAGLWKGQTDEEELGLDYRTLDDIIEAFDSGRQPDAPAESVEHVRSLIGKAGHKLSPPPAFFPPDPQKM